MVCRLDALCCDADASRQRRFRAVAQVDPAAHLLPQACLTRRPKQTLEMSTAQIRPSRDAIVRHPSRRMTTCNCSGVARFFARQITTGGWLGLNQNRALQGHRMSRARYRTRSSLSSPRSWSGRRQLCGSTNRRELRHQAERQRGAIHQPGSDDDCAVWVGAVGYDGAAICAPTTDAATSGGSPSVLMASGQWNGRSHGLESVVSQRPVRGYRTRRWRACPWWTRVGPVSGLPKALRDRDDRHRLHQTLDGPGNPA